MKEETEGETAMRLSRAVELSLRFRETIKAVYGASYNFARTHTEHLAEIDRSVWSAYDYQRLPRWAQAEVRGCDRTMFDRLYEFQFGQSTPLMYVKIGPDGRRFGPGDDSWLQESSEYKQALTGRHVWAHRWPKEFRPW